MNSVGKPLVVPRQNESTLVVPRFSDLVALTQANQLRLSESNIELNGTSLSALRSQAQAEVMAAAKAYTSNLAGIEVSSGQGPWVVTGHQPALFHAGVWAKNFAGAGVARATQGIALNLVIDNDVLSGTRIAVPAGTRHSPGTEWISFDQSPIQQPWEERSIIDRECFQSFGHRVAEEIRRCWNYEPLVAVAWNAAVAHSKVSPRLCDCLTAARVAIERSRGLQNLEVPMSRVCATLAFGQFAALLIAHLPRFHAIYNEAVHAYRIRHHLRSHTHPVPDLLADDGWYEAPFWVWRTGGTRRERLFARQTGSEVLLRAGSEILMHLPLTPDRPLNAAADAIADLSNQGVRLRSRALTTTLFARLFLADLFIHGIGGATYDAMTDQICRRFLRIEAPQFATVTATVQLPLGPAFPASSDDLHRLDHRIREVRYNPDRVYEFEGELPRSLVAEKQQLVAGFATRRPNSAEHQRLGEINSQLSALLEPVRRTLMAERMALRYRLRANDVLQNREFSWCLHPPSLLDFFQREFGPTRQFSG